MHELIFNICFLICALGSFSTVNTKGYFEKTKDYELFYNKPTPENSKVVAVSIFRPDKISDPKKFQEYLDGLEKGAKCLPSVLPGWIYRIYADYSFFAYNDHFSQEFKKILSEISNLPHVQIIFYEYPDFLEKDGIHHKKLFGMLPRFHASADSNLKAALFRNARNPITKADANFVKQWLETEKQLFFYYTPKRLVPHLKNYYQCNDIKNSLFDRYNNRFITKNKTGAFELDIITNAVFGGM